MPNRIWVTLGTAVLSMFIALPAVGQSVAAATPADLLARLKELEGNPRQLDTVSRAGRKVAAFCANCHGDGGNSVKPDVPNLAGQNSVYLLEQVRDIAEGRRKASEFHTRLIRVLSPDEKIGMITFYAGQEVTVKPAANPALAQRGGELYDSKCAECHEADGRGTKKWPRLAGQQTVYLTTTLKGFRDATGARMKRHEKEIKGMTDADIAATVAFLASMK